jgi:hypothetical protein
MTSWVATNTRLLILFLKTGAALKTLSRLVTLDLGARLRWNGSRQVIPTQF